MRILLVTPTARRAMRSYNVFRSLWQGCLLAAVASGMLGISPLLAAALPAVPPPSSSATTAPPPPTAAAGPCHFILGFATLHDMIATQTGECLENQYYAPNGDAWQHTRNGLMAWRKADNRTTFTNGYQTWLNGPNGLVKRFNDEWFEWEAYPAQTNGV
ncbi:MAG TPA: hypothetical protein VKU60_02880, partial [Chloroflexota bacterium]|nr:hypothetical protein [Chloroflexota bacterium]